MSNDLCALVGFTSHTYREYKGIEGLGFEKLGIHTLNASKACGYIPLLGLITGVIKMILASNVYKGISASEDPEKRNNLRKFTVILVVRAVCEFIGLGLLFLIPDAIATVKAMRSGHFFKPVNEERTPLIIPVLE